MARKGDRLNTALKVLTWLQTAESKAPRIPFLPTWVNLVGWTYHLAIGTLARVVAPHHAFAFALGCGLGHEWADGDFKVAGGLDGALDVVFFCLPILL